MRLPDDSVIAKTCSQVTRGPTGLELIDNRLHENKTRYNDSYVHADLRNDCNSPIVIRRVSGSCSLPDVEDTEDNSWPIPGRVLLSIGACRLVLRTKGCLHDSDSKGPDDGQFLRPRKL